MALYRPGTLDDDAVCARRDRKTSRLALDANSPTGSNVFGTTERVQEMETSKSDLAERLDAVETLLGEFCAVGACIVSSAAPPSIGGWQAVGTVDIALAAGGAVKKTVYERIE